MSDTNADQQEPSMEEILASIRRIISEDGDEESDDEVVAASGDEEPPVEAVNYDNSDDVENDNDDDILELTDVIDDGQNAEPEPELEPEPEPIEVIEVPEDKLVSDEVEEVSAASMSGLTAVLAANAALGDGNKTLEQLVKDVLRPVLKQWLDDNLPEIVDRIVQEEVERIAKRAK
jgi:cell pole-organizing protein PopZ